MKIAIIGDIHGRTNWQKIPLDNYDKIVFLGDYFDPYGLYTTEQLIDNFQEIMFLKARFPDKIITLFGNHDLSYVNEFVNHCRFRPDVYDLMCDNFRELVYKDKLSLCCFIDNFIFSHAGFTKTWVSNSKLPLDEYYLNLDFKNSVLSGKIDKYDFILKHWSQSSYGDDIFQGPLWVRESSLNFDKVDDYIQIIGHTRSKDFQDYDRIYMCDSLDWNLYYVLDTETKELSQIEIN